MLPTLMRLRVVVCFLAASAIWAVPVCAQQEIKAPFGMQWGETPARIREVVTKAKAKITGERMAGRRDVLEVEGIVQEGLKRTLFYFTENGLSEIELQYEREGWDDTRVAGWVGSIKRQADLKYGPGRLFADERGNTDGISHRLQGWMWVQNFVSLRLVYYSAQKGEEKLKRVSLHYCSQ